MNRRRERVAGVDADDARWMDAAVEQARRGLGRTAPNPSVGCVLVRDGEIVGRGFHRRAGDPHAEIDALRDAGTQARGADLYVTLEPCCHSGRTGPCTEALVAAGVRRVIAGCADPNPRVSGKGARALRRAGVPVAVGVRKGVCEELIRGFRQWVLHDRPWVELKLAASLDGRIAAAGGASKWLSSADSRRVVQTMRERSDAILVGVGTVLADDPRLTCRRPGAKQPLRVILDRELRTPPAARVVHGRGKCLLVGAKRASPSRRRRLERAGAEVLGLDVGARKGWLRLLGELGRRGVLELLVEGGSRVATSALRAGVVNGLTLFYTPKLLGADGIPLVGPLGVRDPAKALRVRRTAVESSGPDVIWTGVFG